MYNYPVIIIYYNIFIDYDWIIFLIFTFIIISIVLLALLSNFPLAQKGCSTIFLMIIIGWIIMKVLQHFGLLGFFIAIGRWILKTLAKQIAKIIAKFQETDTEFIFRFIQLIV